MYMHVMALVGSCNNNEIINMGFSILYGGYIYIDIPLTGIYAIGATIFILHRWQLMNCTGAC